MSDKDETPNLFNLTEMTGAGRNKNRTVVIATFEMERKTFLLFLSGLPAALITLGFTFPFIGVYAFFVSAVVMTAWILFFGSKRSRGLQVNRFAALRDLKVTKAQKFTLCGEVIDVTNMFNDFQLVHSDAPVYRNENGSIADSNPQILELPKPEIILEPQTVNLLEYLDV